MYSGQYWWWVRADVAPAHQAFAAALGSWWSDHAIAFAREQNATHAWRLETENVGGRGSGQPVFSAIYEFSDTAAFDGFLVPPTQADWAPFADTIDNWTDTIYRIRLAVNPSDDQGAYWAVVPLADDSGSSAEDGGAAQELGEMARRPGFHRSWLVETFRHPVERGSPDEGLLAAYQLDDPSCFPSDAGIGNVSFHRVILAYAGELVRSPYESARASARVDGPIQT